LELCGREQQGLTKILILQFGKLPLPIHQIGIKRRHCQRAPHGDSCSADAGLPAHHCGIKSDSVKSHF
jgi:hypothetical protein